MDVDLQKEKSLINLNQEKNGRYRGPQSRISRRFGEPIFGPDKVLERKNYPADNGQIKEEVNNLNMVFSYKKNKKLNLLTEF